MKSNPFPSSLYVGAAIRNVDCIGINFSVPVEGDDTLHEETVAEVLPGCGDKLMQEQSEYIVNAVNAHDTLVAAIKMVLTSSEDGGTMNDIDFEMLRAALTVANPK